MNENVTNLKILLTGNGGVGKTSMIHRLVKDEFSTTIEQTIGVEFLAYNMEIDDKKVKLQLWDTAGQEQYRALGKIYYRNAIGVLCVFSIIDHNSFLALKDWLKDVRMLCHPNAKIIIVGNKADLSEERQITESEIQSLCSSYSVEYIESSAKTGQNVKETFYRLARDILIGLHTGDIVLQMPSIEDSKAHSYEVFLDKQPQKKSCCH